jgi:hypothetical protein
LKNQSALSEQDSIPATVGHFRHMLDAKDGFSVLVRGMVLIDRALDVLLDAYLAVRLKKLKAAIPQLTLNGKVSLALAVGAMNEHEHTFVRECNGLRNRVSHRMNMDVTPDEEEQIVALYGSKIERESGFSAGEPFVFPNRLAFALILASTRLQFRAERLRRKPLYDVRDSATSKIASLGHACAMICLARQGGERDEERVKQIVLAYVRTAAVGMRIVEARQRGATYEEAVESLSQPPAKRRRRYPRG